MPTEKFTFRGHQGTDLAGRLDLPAGKVLATALFAHCFTCGKDIPAARRIAARLSGKGIAVLRFDFTGLGHSAGEFANTTFTSNAQDLKAAADALAERGLAPSLLIGHSLGGAAIIAAARQIEGARAVVTLGAPFDPAHVTENFAHALDRIETEGAAAVNLGGREVTIGRDFVADVSKAKLGEALAHLDPALLVMHAPRDMIVGIENAKKIFSAAKHPKSFVTLDDADHLITRPEDAEYAAGVIAAWAERYLGLRPPAPPKGAPEGVIRVSEADPEGFLQDINGGPRHHSVADEPHEFGGTDLGMSPYGFLAAGLGACTSMTIRMYARRKGWPLDHVAVDVTHDRAHAPDAGDPGAPKIERFHRRIRLVGALTPDQLQRLREIADKCPVHRTLEKGAEVVTELSETEPAD